MNTENSTATVPVSTPLTRGLAALAAAALDHRAEFTSLNTLDPEEGDATYDVIFTYDSRARLFRERAMVVCAEHGIDVSAPLYPSEDHERYHVDLTLTVESARESRYSPDLAAQEREEVERDERGAVR